MTEKSKALFILCAPLNLRTRRKIQDFRKFFQKLGGAGLFSFALLWVEAGASGNALRGAALQLCITKKDALSTSGG